MTERGREQWLNPPHPETTLESPLAAETRALVERARQVWHNQATRQHRELLMFCEAQASSQIEGIYDDPTEDGSSSNRLTQAIPQTLTSTHSRDITGWHLALMARHPDPRMLPGQYRAHGVRVGDWTPPHHSELFWRMEQFHQWMSAEDDPLMRVIVGHRYFETIHPFADGNGRTGRLLIIQALQVPITVSRIIWWDQQEYYRQLSKASWEEWQWWMLAIIGEAAQLSLQDMAREPVEPTFTAVSEMNIRR